MDPREADLVRRFQKGDLEAAGALVKKYTKITVGLIYSNVGRIQEADDLVQEVFLEAQKSAMRIRNPDSFPSWMYKITQRVCNRWLREHKRAPVSLEQPEDIQGSQSEANEEESEAEQVRRVVDAMPRRLREVIYMRYFQELSYERMGDLLDISSSAVNARLMKARKLLKSRLASGRVTDRAD